MAEIFSVVLIFLSIYLLFKPYKTNQILQSGIFSATAISFAYFVKIQFLYVVAILPAVVIMCLIFKLKDKRVGFKQLVSVSAFLIVYLLLYLLLWYWPNNEFLNYVMTDQTSNRFVKFSSWISQFNLNLHLVFYNHYLRLFLFAFYGLYIIGIVCFFRYKNLIFRYLFIAFSCWIVFELHKMLMTYLPTRYLISCIFSNGTNYGFSCNRMCCA